MTKDMTLKERVDAFRLMELPGQPRMMHMGTHRLVEDLWLECQRLNAALSMTREGLEADEAKLAQNCES